MFSKKIQILVILIILLSLTTLTFAKNTKYDELRFQLGFGLTVSTSNLLGLIESVRIYEATSNNQSYDYPGVSDSEKAALNELNGAMQRALLVSNILGGMEYSFQLRILWHMLYSEVNLTLLPFDGSYNGRLDFAVTPMIGIRAPFFLMPYLALGVPFTFSFYPNDFTSIENWKGDWAATDNFCFRPGLAVKVGFDLKFKAFSIGGYYLYSIKDFQEFSLWYNKIIDAGVTSADAAGMIFGAQSRFGVAIVFYPF